MNLDLSHFCDISKKGFLEAKESYMDSLRKEIERLDAERQTSKELGVIEENTTLITWFRGWLEKMKDYTHYGQFVDFFIEVQGEDELETFIHRAMMAKGDFMNIDRDKELDHQLMEFARAQRKVMECARRVVETIKKNV